MQQIKEALKKYPGIKNIIYVTVSNPSYPDSMVLVGKILKFWIYTKEQPPSQAVEANILLLRGAGFITGCLRDGQFKASWEDDKPYDLDFVISGAIIKWIGDGELVDNRPYKTMFEEKDIFL